MISYSVYKVVHLAGILMVFLALGGATTNAINGGSKKHSWSKPLALTHGMGLFLSLVGGFGLLARIGIAHGQLPIWAIAKIGIWIFFAILLMALLRKPNCARISWPVIIGLGALAAYLAGNKPS